MSVNEIKKKYLELHDALGRQRDAEDKDLFDQQHEEIWHNCGVELTERKDELVAKQSLTDNEVIELRELKMEFPDPIPPGRNLLAEIDELKARLDEIGIIRKS